jgi:hypothetical protein
MKNETNLADKIEFHDIYNTDHIFVPIDNILKTIMCKNLRIDLMEKISDELIFDLISYDVIKLFDLVPIDVIE